LKEVFTAMKNGAKERGVELPAGWKKETRKVFNLVDADKSGKVSQEEFEGAIKKYGV
tara:strand:+ start:379 stop:549 length:171 start_codon:yes stop_codon:yes gene_type:complete